MRAALLLVCLSLAWPATAKPPVVVEVFTAQGCQACVEAGGLVEELAERDDLIPLTFTVDYWDYLGWRDTFARPEFAERQRDYAKRLAAPGVYTPQVVVDGAGEAKALEAGRVEQLITTAARAPRNPPDIEIQKRRVLVGSGKAPAGGAEVWLIRYDPRGREVTVTGGENRGKTITYRNVVRELVRLGDWKGRPSAYALPKQADPALQTLVLVQQPRGGPVLALLND